MSPNLTVKKIALASILLAACSDDAPPIGGDVVTAGQPPTCTEPQLPLGTVGGTYDLEWRCVWRFQDGNNQPIGECHKSENPLFGIKSGSIAEVDAQRFQITIGSSVAVATRDGSDSFSVAAGVDGANRRESAFGARCTDGMLLVGIVWRTVADDAEETWQALATKR